MEEKVRALIEDTIVSNGYILSEVLLETEDNNKFLRIVIDKEGRIDVDDCVAVTRLINPIIDENDPIEGFYILDVCSKMEGSE